MSAAGRHVEYGASKNALESYTMAAAELGRYGITANVVCPPVTDTGLYDKLNVSSYRIGSTRRTLSVKATTIATISLALALAVNACSTGAPATPTTTQPTAAAAAALPTAPPPTATAVPPTAALVPSAVPTTAPTSTAAAQVAPNGAASAASDLQPMADALAAIKSYRMSMASTGSAQDQSITMQLDVVKPDRFDIKETSGSTSIEMISIGPDLYIKTGTTWAKSSDASMASAATAVLSNDPINMAAAMQGKNGTLTKGGAEQINGTPCQDWIFTATAPATATASSSGTPSTAPSTASISGTLCIGQNNLPVQYKSNDGTIVVTYSNWNAATNIVAPI